MSNLNASWDVAPSSSSSSHNSLNMLAKGDMSISGGGSGSSSGGLGLNMSHSSLFQQLPAPEASVFAKYRIDGSGQNSNGLNKIAPDKLSAVAMLAAKMKKSSSSSRLAVDHRHDDSGSVSSSSQGKTVAVAEELLRLAASLEKHDASFGNNFSNSSSRSQSSNTLSNAFLSAEKRSRAPEMTSPRSQKVQPRAASSPDPSADILRLSVSMSNLVKSSSSSSLSKKVKKANPFKLKKSTSSNKVSESVDFLKQQADLVADRWKPSPSGQVLSSTSNHATPLRRTDGTSSSGNGGVGPATAALLAATANDLGLADRVLHVASTRGSTGSFRPSKAKMMASADAGKNATFDKRKEPRRKLRKETTETLGLNTPSTSSKVDPISSSFKGLSKTPSKSCLKSSGSSSNLRRAVSMMEITLPSRETVKKENFIKFNELVEVKRVPSSTDLGTAKKDLWFQKDEMNQIRNESKRLVDLLDESVVDPKHVDIRGLEEHRKAERKKSKERIYGGWDAVLDAQDDQRYTGNYNMEEIASLSRKVSMNSLLEAQRKAQKDAKDVVRYISGQHIQ